MSYPRHQIDYCLEPELDLEYDPDYSFVKNKSTNFGSSCKKVSDGSMVQDSTNRGSMVRVMSNSFGGKRTTELQKILRSTIQTGRYQGIWV